MKIRPEEISSVIKERIEAFGEVMDVAETGKVVYVGDNIARVYGLSACMAGELVEFPGGVMGLALNLEEDSVGIVVMGEDVGIKEGDSVRRTGRILEVPAGDAMIGRIIDPLGNPLDGRGDIVTDQRRVIERVAPGVVWREPVNVPLQTGIKAIDSMTPIGRGQRELIIGDRQTGKTAILLDTILNQHDQDVICIYVAIGQKRSSVAKVVKTFEEFGALKYTIIVSADASVPVSLQYIAPYAGCAIGEHFMEQGRDVLVCYDDLSKHAVAYREISLLLRRPPGREAYPGDIFYLHSRLLERAVKLNKQKGGGSLTALPVIETRAGNVAAYIPTNVISITDGQIYLEGDLFYQGIRPAMNVGISVSRVGGKAQNKAMKKVAGSLRLDLAQYRELESFAQFGSDLDAAAQAQLARGQRLVELLKQGVYEPRPVNEQIVVIYAGTQGLIDDVRVDDIRDFEKSLVEWMRQNRSGLLDDLKSKAELTQEIDQALKTAIREFKQSVFFEKLGRKPVEKKSS
jgi:F-type H+-transporting ATPase subunit alpha